jgi:tight adherence protein B
MGPVLIAGLTFLTVASVILALWWVLASQRELRVRLTPAGETAVDSRPTPLGSAILGRFPLMEQLVAVFPWIQRLEQLTEQAGWTGGSGRALGLIAVSAAIGGVIGAVRMGNVIWGILWAVVAGTVPVLYLRYLRHKRLEKFSEQFPEALDMMTRSLRTGYAVGASFQMVAEEMPDPVASEFRRVFEQMALGRPTTEALQEMYDRVKTEDVRFFYVAVSIQREVGGNLAEILDKLSEVVRERYKLLAFARVLSAQQMVSAYCISASPFVAALALTFGSPGWFDPLWAWPPGKYVLLGVGVWMAIGFFVLRRIANIKV